MIDPLEREPAPDMDPTPQADAFTIARHGDVTVIAASPALEHMEPALVEGAATILVEALKGDACPQVVVDLGDLHYFGSTFLGLLIRCSKLATSRGGAMVLARVSEQAKFLLHITSLDMVWPLYAGVREAVEALESE